MKNHKKNDIDNRYLEDAFKPSKNLPKSFQNSSQIDKNQHKIDKKRSKIDVDKKKHLKTILRAKNDPKKSAALNETLRLEVGKAPGDPLRS